MKNQDNKRKDHLNTKKDATLVDSNWYNEYSQSILFRKSRNTSAEMSKKSRNSPIEKIGQTLFLEILSSNFLPKESCLEITQNGLSNSLRSSSDGVVYFGFVNESDLDKNDFLLSNERPEDASRDQKGRHFMIYYDKYEKNFFLRDLNIGFGCFLMVKEYELLDSTLIQIGNTYLVIAINKFHNSTRLVIKPFSKFIKSDPIHFLPCMSPITIGRSEKCSLSIKDELLSRYHCEIRISEDFTWTIRDGSYNINNPDDSWKESLNATWVFVSENIKIEDGHIFKYNCNLFRVIILFILVSFGLN
jgi:hypothetical protein